MSQSFRLADIMNHAQAHGRVMVEDLADRFGVTVQTIRRDLTLLTNTGDLERVHGGAVLPYGTTNTPYEARRAQHHDAKKRIASACAARLPNGASVCLNIGTTTEAVARALTNHTDLLVVTNNMQVAKILADTAEVVLTAGKLRAADGGLTGPLTCTTLRQFKFDFAVIGCSALDRDGDILDFDVSEVEATQAVLGQARQSILVADASKFERKAPARIGNMSAIDCFLTDRTVPQRLSHRCRTWKTEIQVV